MSCLNSQALCSLNPWDTNPSREDRVLGNPDSMGHDKDGIVSTQDTHILWDTTEGCVLYAVWSKAELRWCSGYRGHDVE